MTIHGDLGPYMNDDGDWWVPVTRDDLTFMNDDGVWRIPETPYRQARALVVGCLSYEIPDDGTLVYKGKAKTWLDSGHAVGDCDIKKCPSSRHVLAYHWEENRKW